MGEEVGHVLKVRIHQNANLLVDKPEIMNVNEVADLLGVVPATVRCEIYRGNLEAFRVGRCVRIARAALIGYLERSEG